MKRIVAGIVAATLLAVSFTGCLTEEQTAEARRAQSASEAAAASSRAKEEIVSAPNYPSEPFYFSTSNSNPQFVSPTGAIGASGRGHFLYGPKQQALNRVAWVDGEIDPLTLPEGVFHCYIDREYDETFAGYGLLAGAWVSEEASAIEISVSEDIGQSWRRVTVPLPRDDECGYKTSLAFTSPSEGCVSVVYDYGRSCDSAIFFRTDDGGETWRQTNVYSGANSKDMGEISFVTSEIGEIIFVTSQHFYVSVYVIEGDPETLAGVRDTAMFVQVPRVLETFDGGATWQPCRIDFPSYFDVPDSYSLGGGAMEFLRSERGLYGVANGYIKLPAGQHDPHGHHNEDSRSAAEVRVALIPREENGATVWRPEGAWNFGGDINPYYFFRHMNIYHFEPGYYGVEPVSGGSWPDKADGVVKDYIDSGLSVGIGNYALQHKPEAIKMIPPEDPEEPDARDDYLVSRKLVADMVALVYNVTDLDVTALGGYSADLDGVRIRNMGNFQGSWEDVYDVSTLPNGDIAIIYQTLPVSGESGYYDKQVQRCVFRPVTTASGVQMFTLMACEILEDYPGAGVPPQR